jgi:pimeloyl-ACP methyl ester carboxylesterase
MKYFWRQTSVFSHEFLLLTRTMIFIFVSFSINAQDHHSYFQRGDSSLQLTLYEAETPLLSNYESRETIILFAHGGGFSEGSRLQTINNKFCQSLNYKGFKVASVDYRLRQKRRGFHCNIPIEEKREAIAWAAQDILDAWNYLQTLGFNKVILVGTSAGAEAALYAAYHIEANGIEGVISISGAMEPLPNFDSRIPLLALHGVCDRLIPFDEGFHHFCPEDSPGALLLQGGGALAKSLPFTRLISYENKGHELSSELLLDPAALDAMELFIRDIQSKSPISRVIEIPCKTQIPCAMPTPR